VTRLTSKSKPVVLFAFRGVYSQWDLLVESLEELGLHTVNATSLQMFNSFAQQNGTYVVFMDIGFAPSIMKSFLSNRAEHRSFYAIGQGLSNAQRNKLFQIGFEDVLPLPLNPHTVKSKTINALIKKLSKTGIPANYHFSRFILDKVLTAVSGNASASHDRKGVSESSFKLIKGDKYEKSSLSVLGGEKHSTTIAGSIDTAPNLEPASGIHLENEKRDFLSALGNEFEVLGFVPHGKRRLEQAVKAKVGLKLWSKGRRSVLALKGFDFEKATNQLRFEGLEKQTCDDLKMIVESDPGSLAFLNFNLNDEGRIFSYVSKTMFNFNELSCSCGFANEVYQVQRRKEPRVYLKPEFKNSFITVKGNKLKASTSRILNLSGSGLCLQMSAALSCYLNLVSHSVEGALQVAARQIDLNLKMKWRTAHQAGFEFEGVESANVHFINDYLKNTVL